MWGHCLVHALYNTHDKVHILLPKLEDNTISDICRIFGGHCLQPIISHQSKDLQCTNVGCTLESNNETFGINHMIQGAMSCLFLSMAFSLNSFFQCYRPWLKICWTVSLTRKGLSSPRQCLKHWISRMKESLLLLVEFVGNQIIVLNQFCQLLKITYLSKKWSLF